MIFKKYGQPIGPWDDQACYRAFEKVGTALGPPRAGQQMKIANVADMVKAMEEEKI